MKINSMTVTPEQNTRAVTFGFWQPSMGFRSEFQRHFVREYSIKPRPSVNPLKGPNSLEIFKISSELIEKIKTRFVNIKGTQLKKKRTTLTEFVHSGYSFKYKQDEMPSGTLITEKKNSNGYPQEKIVEKRNGNWWHKKTAGEKTTVNIYKPDGSKTTYQKTSNKGKYTKIA